MVVVVVVVVCVCVCVCVWGGKKFVGHCHSVIHEYETIQIFKFSGGGGISGLSPLCMKPCYNFTLGTTSLQHPHTI